MEECSCRFVTGGSTAYAAWNGSALPIIHMLRVYLAVNGHLACPRCFADYLLVRRSLAARYATSKILANSSRRPKFNRIAFRAWLTSNQPEICLFEITFSSYVHVRAAGCRSMEPCQRINRRGSGVKNSEGFIEPNRSTVLSSFFFSFFSSFNSSEPKLRTRKGQG